MTAGEGVAVFLKGTYSYVSGGGGVSLVCLLWTVMVSKQQAIRRLLKTKPSETALYDSVVET